MKKQTEEHKQIHDMKKTYHLWGIRQKYTEVSNGIRYEHLYNGWEHLKECTPDRRAIIGIDKREWSQLEIREDSGRTILTIDTLEDNRKK